MGDEDFKKFINENGKESENSNLPFYMVLCAREKARAITDMYEVASNIFKEVKTDPEKKDIRKYLKKLEMESLCTLRQFDMIMIGFDDLCDDDEEDMGDDLIEPRVGPQ